MFDLAQRPEALQRARGCAEVVLGANGVERLFQQGSAKAFLPKSHAEDVEVVFLNTSGGLTGGDRLSYSLDLKSGSATATTQTAERAYAANGGFAAVSVELIVGAGATLHWLPQETILFDNSALSRRTDVALAGDAAFLMAETVVLGRAAMGEKVRDLAFSDRRSVWRDGVPVLVEPLRLGTDELARRGGAVTLGGARSFTTVSLLAQGAEDALGPVRAVLESEGVEAAASGWDGKVIVRAMAGDAWPLRRLVARVLTVLRGRPLPRVWQV